MSKVFLDTNIIAYAFDKADAEKRISARRALSENKRFAVSTQVLLELYVVLTRKLRPPVPTKDATAIVRQTANFEVVGADRQLVLKAVDVSSKHQLSVWDSMIVCAAAEAGCDELWTEDLADGATLLGVKIVDPLRMN